MFLFYKKKYGIDDINKFDINELSTLDMIQCDNMSESLLKKLTKKYSADDQALHAMAELASLSYFCLYRNGKRAFLSASQIIKCFTADLLCEVSKRYFNMTIEKSSSSNGFDGLNGYIEKGVNESYAMEVNQLDKEKDVV